jgi:DegV family protein with EDD domain
VGEEIDSAAVAAALRGWTPVTTSRPAPATLLAGYEKLAADGATAFVSVHISAEMSGTYAAAQLAARDAPVPVRVVDSRSLGMGLGFATLAAAEAAEAGGDVETVAAAAESRAAGTRAYFYVDTLEHLRRGGRIGSAQALIGSALAVKPLLELRDGRIEPLERVRTSSRALARLEELTVAAAAGQVDVAVHHLACPERAEQLSERLAARLPDVRRRYVLEVGAVVGAHVGPGMVAAVLAPVTSPPQGA